MHDPTVCQHQSKISQRTTGYMNGKSSCMCCWDHTWECSDLGDVLLLGAELRGVVVVDDLERLAPVGEVARVDADLLERVRHHQCHRRLEVDVCHQGHVVPARPRESCSCEGPCYIVSMQWPGTRPSVGFACWAMHVHERSAILLCLRNQGIGTFHSTAIVVAVCAMLQEHPFLLLGTQSYGQCQHAHSTCL